MTDETDTQPQPEPQPERPSQPGPPPPAARPKLTRSSTDRLVGGVAGGLGRHLNIDPLALRITFVILSFAGGLGVLAYALCLVFVPTDDPNAPPMRWGLARTVGAGLLAVAALAFLIPDWAWGPGVPLLLMAGVVAYLLLRVIRDDGATHLGRTAAKAGIGIVLLCLAVGGFVAAAAGAALGGGIVVAGLVMACGVGLLGGAFRGGARWLIAPALVLALPLAAVAATDLDVRGTWGDRTFRPASVAELAKGYEMGAGSMRVDLREVTFPVGRTDLRLDLGMGEMQVLVPPRTCVTVDATIGVGAYDTGHGEQGGVDLDIADRTTVAPGVRRLHIDADVGLGAVRVGELFGPEIELDRGWDEPDHFDDLRTGTSLAACRGAA